MQRAGQGLRAHVLYHSVLKEFRELRTLCRDAATL
jgi:hypothetical protein